MNFKTHNENKNIRTSGCSRQGHVKTTFKRLTEVFGKDNGSGDKTQAEWEIEFENGVVATIYDWKSYTNVENITEWNIGGFDDTDVVALVKETLL
jgi:hypothetical protein